MDLRNRQILRTEVAVHSVHDFGGEFHGDLRCLDSSETGHRLKWNWKTLHWCHWTVRWRDHFEDRCSINRGTNHLMHFDSDFGSGFGSGFDSEHCRLIGIWTKSDGIEPRHCAVRSLMEWVHWFRAVHCSPTKCTKHIVGGFESVARVQAICNSK